MRHHRRVDEAVSDADHKDTRNDHRGIARATQAQQADEHQTNLR